MVLICGGAGYIGSHMAKLLRRSGVPHAIFDNLERGHATAAAGSELIHGDLRNPSEIDEVLAGSRFDTVMHFAAYIEVGESVADPAKFWQNNVFAVWNLLESCRRHGISKFIFSSTAAVYGEPLQLPIPESHALSPTSPYGDSKLAVERMLSAYDRAYGLKSIVLRYFNACGADPEGELGEDHRPETHLIPRVLLAAAGRAPAITVFGQDYETPDGTCVRDYVHVQDLAAAHLLALRRIGAYGKSECFNLGSGRGFSVQQVIDSAREVTGRDFPVEYGPRRAGDPALLIADSARARSELGWNPEFDDVRVCVRHAWEWMLRNPNGYES